MKYSGYLRWLLFACLVGVGVYVYNYNGHIGPILESDTTNISALIMTLFVGASVWCGLTTFKVNRVSDGDDVTFARKTSDWLAFLAGAFTALGMLGTVTGFIAVLDVLGNIDMAETAKVQMAMTQVTAGVGVALYTTLTGLACSLLLRTQNENLSMLLNDHNDDAETMS